MNWMSMTIFGLEATQMMEIIIIWAAKRIEMKDSIKKVENWMKLHAVMPKHEQIVTIVIITSICPKQYCFEACLPVLCSQKSIVIWRQLRCETNRMNACTTFSLDMSLQQQSVPSTAATAAQTISPPPLRPHSLVLIERPKEKQKIKDAIRPIKFQRGWCALHTQTITASNTRMVCTMYMFNSLSRLVVVFISRSVFLSPDPINVLMKFRQSQQRTHQRLTIQPN